MRVVFYPSYRSLAHGRSSGLVSIATDVYDALQQAGHEVILPFSQSMEWIYLRPQAWAHTLCEFWQAHRDLNNNRADCWLTYHSYYKGPDVLGPIFTKRHNLPYFLLEASYATKYRRHVKTWPGFHLNKKALLAADVVFLNKKRDVENLGRLLPPERISYIKPGIDTQAFFNDATIRENIRQQLGLTGKLVVMTAAMMRPGVKEDGLAFVIDCCADILGQIDNLHLLIVGDGPGKMRLEEQAGRLLPKSHTFVGYVQPDKMPLYYQAGDVFAFPGINESLGMVYLEAQCCGLPVVATIHDGAPEVVAHKESGLLVRPFSKPDFSKAILSLLTDNKLRSLMSYQARQRVLQQHDMSTNYRTMIERMHKICEERRT